MQVDDLSYVGRIQQLRPGSLTRAASDALPRHLAEALDSDWPAIYLPFGTVFNLNNTFTAAVAALGRLQEGSARLLGALAHGIPQLCLPQGADQFRNAHTFEAAGAGIALIGADATTDRNAKRLAAEIAGLPSAEDAVTALEQLID